MRRTARRARAAKPGDPFTVPPPPRPRRRVLSPAAAARREAERRRLARLARCLADKTRDAKLRDLLECAIAVDFASPGWRDGEHPTAGELRESRSDAWMRLWAHLAGQHRRRLHRRDDVLVMGRYARGRGDGIAWVVAQVASAPGMPPIEAESALVWDVHSDATGVRIDGPRTAATWPGYARRPVASESALVEHLRLATELAGRGWAESLWGEMGSATPSRSPRRAALPLGKQSAARLVREQADAAVADARGFVEAVRGPWRMQLDHQLRLVVVYLAHHGHGALRKRGWRRTAQVILGVSPATTRQWSFEAEDAWDTGGEARTLRDDYNAAKRRVRVARRLPAPYRPSLGRRRRP